MMNFMDFREFDSQNANLPWGKLDIFTLGENVNLYMIFIRFTSNRSEGEAEPHPNGCILFAHVRATRGRGVRRGLGWDQSRRSLSVVGMGWPVPSAREIAKSAKSAISTKFSGNGGIF